MEAPGLGVLAVVGLDECGVAQALLGDGRDRAGPAAFLPRRRLDPLRELAGHDSEQRGRDQRREREFPVQVEQQPAEYQDLHTVRDELHDAGEHQLFDRVDIAGEPRHEVAELATLEESERHPVQVSEKSCSQVEDEPFADPRAQIVVDEGKESTQDGDPDVRRGDHGEQCEIARREHVVDEDLEDPDAGGVHRRADRDEHQAHREPQAEGLGQRPEPGEDLPDAELRSGGDQRRLRLGEECRGAGAAAGGAVTGGPARTGESHGLGVIGVRKG